VASSRESLAGFKLIHLMMYSWGPSILQKKLCASTILSLSAMDNSFDLMAWFLFWHALSIVGPFYIDRCVPIQIMSNQLNLPQVDSITASSQNISRMINVNRMHQSTISSLLAKGLSTYVNKVLLFYFNYIF
jgi:hypothetical protein